MASYKNLAKLGRTELPSGTTYKLIDLDLREMIAPNFNAEASYEVGDYVIYDVVGSDDSLYRFTNAHAAGAWNSADVELVVVGDELKRISKAVVGGIIYRGKTTSMLYDDCTINPITINGNSYTAVSGDLVKVDRANAALTYATNTAYAVHTYIKNDGIYYITKEVITAAQNINFNAIQDKLTPVKSDPEFLFDGTVWGEVGSADGLGELAYKNTASGTYTKPTGSGSVTINTYNANTSKLATTSITPVNGTVNASNITNIATDSFATAAASATTVATAASEATKVGNADVGTAVSVGTSLTGTTTFVTAALKSASLTGTTTFNTDAIKSASIAGTDGVVAAKTGITTSVNGDCLVFSTAGTTTLSVSTSAASKGTVSISTINAGSTEKGTVTLGTTSITPAKALSSTSNTVLGVGGTTTITGVGGTAKAVTGVTYTSVTPAAKGTAVTVATGSLDSTGSGATVATGITSGTTSATVSVGTTTDTVTVR